MRQKWLAWILMFVLTASMFGVQAVTAQDETPPPYGHPEVPSPDPVHPPQGNLQTSRDGDSYVLPGASSKTMRDGLSAQSMGTPGLSFRYLTEYGESMEPYLADNAHLNRPNGIFVDEARNLFVTEEGFRVLKYDAAGAHQLTIGSAGIPWSHDNYIGGTRDVVTDASGNIWVLINPSIKKFDSTGNFLESFPYENSWQSGTDNDHFNNDPWGLAFGPGGFLYVADSNNHRIQIMDTSGVTAPSISYVTTIGTGNRENDNSGFSFPTRVAFDSSDNMYVMDSDNNRVQKCTSGDPSDPITEPWTCITFFGETGFYDFDITHLSWASGITVDDADNIFISDNENYRVLKCDTSANCQVFAGVTREDGNDDARFDFNSDVAVDDEGNIYISDTNNFRVQKFNIGGEYVSTYGVTGIPYLTDTSHFYSPEGVAVANDGSIYISERGGKRLLKLNPDGSVVWTVGEAGVGGTDIYHFGRYGNNLEGNIAVDAGGKIYVPDQDNNRVQIFNPNGTYYATIGTGWGFGTYKFRCLGGVAINPTNQDILVVDRCNQRVQVYSSARVYKGTLGVTDVSGSDNSHFRWPWGVAVDSGGNIYVGDSDNYRVQKCTLGGGCTTFVGETGVQNNDFYHFYHPEYIAVDSFDRVYVGDAWNQRVNVYDSNGLYLTTIGGDWGSDSGQMTSVRGLAVDSSGNLYIADSDTHRVQKFARGVPDWQQVNINGFEDVNHGLTLSMAAYNSKLYAGLEDFNTGGQIWESSNGTTWTQLMGDGFGDPSNVDILRLYAYNNRLYAGTSNSYYDIGLDDWLTNGAEMWRYDGNTWEDVTPAAMDGSTNSDFFSMAEFNGYLYAGTTAFDNHGSEVWRCQTCDGTDWEQVESAGFGDDGNWFIASLESFNNRLYAGTWGNSNGAELWRCSICDGSDWTQVNDDGFGNSGNRVLSSLASFGGYLYTATDSRNSGFGTEVWRCQTCNNTDWTKVVSNGMGNAETNRRPTLISLGGTLYLFMGNHDTGMETWRTLNGTTWIESAPKGFGNINNKSSYFDNAATVLNSNLYVGTYNWINGTQIWKTSSSQQIFTTTLNSAKLQDGWILESGENTNAGGSVDTNTTTFRLGDDAAKKQYRSMLSFATGAALPDSAVITKVTLKFKKQGITGGGNPITTFQGIYAEIKKGPFGTPSLAITDFSLAANKTIGPVKPNPISNWYSIDLTSGGASINKLASASGLTQIRLRFKLDDNNNTVANYLSLYSGNAPLASQPMLIIEYYVP